MIIKKTLYYFSSILVGVLIFLTLFSIGLKLSIFNPVFHKYLFSKNDVYNKTSSIIKESMNDYQKKLAKIYPQYQNQQKELFLLVQKSTTPQLIKMNIERMTDDLFAYFRNEKVFLPDIYLNTEANPLEGKDRKSETQSTIDYTKIKKINLNTVLLYLNRSDISDEILFFKFLYNANNIVPQLSILLLFFFCILGIITCKNFKETSHWVTITLLSSGVLGILVSVFLFCFYSYVLPGSIYPLTISLPLDQSTILSYLRNMIAPVCLGELFTGVLFVILSYISIKLFKNKNIVFNFHQNKIETSSPHPFSKKYSFFMYFLLLLFVSATILYKFNYIKTHFSSSDYVEALNHKYAQTSTQIISAKKDNIYELSIKLFDKNENIPIPNVRIYVTGVSSDKHFDELIFTDDTGTAKLTLDKGNFRISFPPSDSLNKYEIPPPYYVDLKKAGSTIVTINPSPSFDETEQNKWGVAEIEILDDDNNPVENLELNLSNTVPSPNSPDSVYSVSNSKGVAVFKVNATSYKVNFTQMKFPDKYSIPKPFTITVIPDSITRYTIRLVKN